MKKFIIATRRLAILLTLLGTSCEKDVEFRGETRDPKLNLKTMIGLNGENHTIGVTESVLIWGDDKAQPIDNATFKIRRNGIEVPVETSIDEKSGGTHYSFRSPFEAGDRFELEGETPEHGRITASDVVPSPAIIRDVKAKNVNPGTDDYYTRLSVTIADPAGEKNYYAIRLIRIEYYLNRWWEWNREEQKEYFKEEIISHEEEYWREFRKDEILFGNIDGTPTGIRRWSQFSDELIDGCEYTLTLRLDKTGPNRRDPETMPPGQWQGSLVVGQDFRVEILTLSPGLFQYLRSVELAQHQSSSFSEPVQIYSNVTGGYGILGAYNVASATVSPENILP